MLDLILIVIFYILPMICCFRVAYNLEMGLFVILGFVPAWNLLVLVVYLLVKVCNSLDKLIKRIKYR